MNVCTAFNIYKIFHFVPKSINESLNMYRYFIIIFYKSNRVGDIYIYLYVCRVGQVPVVGAISRYMPVYKNSQLQVIDGIQKHFTPSGCMYNSRQIMRYEQVRWHVMNI